MITGLEIQFDKFPFIGEILKKDRNLSGGNYYRQNHPAALPCPVETTLMLIGDKWKVLILRDLCGGTKRFGELKSSLAGISQKVLTSNLRDMEENGLVNRTVYPEVPPKVEYSLTELGLSMSPILDAMAKRGTEFKKRL